jgi:GT2 family glycosyltransferase
MSKSSIAVVVLNWNDAELLPHSVGSLFNQTQACDIIVVDNGSSDNSKSVIESFGSKVIPLWNKDNLGFAGGINTGIRYAIEASYEYIALLNNDAAADKDWVKYLRKSFDKSTKLGGVTSAMLHKGDDTYDSTGDFYTHWGLPFPRGRGELVKGQYDDVPQVTAISGGASMFRAEFFKDVGLFDEDFFAYYEDVDLGLRGKLRGWEFMFVPKAEVLHATGSTSGRVKGFTTYQTFKNLPWIILKNVPGKVFFTVYSRFTLAHFGFFVSAVRRGHTLHALKGLFAAVWLTPKKLVQRSRIQRNKAISSSQFAELLIYDLPPNAEKLRKLRGKYWKLRGKL